MTATRKDQPPPVIDLTGTRAFVVGASRGIGREVAIRLAECGASVAIGARDIAALEPVEKLIRGCGRDCARVALDVLDPGSITAAFAAADSALGPLDSIIVMAGVSVRADIVDMTAEDFDRVLGTNLRGTYFCCRESGRLLLPRGRGSVVLIGSLASHFGMNQVSAYCASKGGVAQLTKSLAVEWAGSGIRVNCVAPGFVATEMTKASLSIKSRRNWILGRTPMNRLGEPSEVADAIAFLTSRAATFITGQILTVDGGFSAGSEW